MSETYHIKIKKNYAKDVIEDLEKMEAVELLSDNENSFTVPEWQIELGKEEAKKISENPSLLMDWEKARKEFKL